MQITQPGILAEETKMARYLEFTITSEVALKTALQALAAKSMADDMVIGIGQSLLDMLGIKIPGLCTMPAQTAAAIDVPSTPAALWCWLRGKDRGEIFHRSRQIETMLAPGFVLSNVIESFQYDANRDLSGYEDGTENPVADEAIKAAIVQNQGAGLDGSSFVAVQQWLHDFNLLDAMTTKEKDDVIGRHISDNEEFDEAPDSAHVKRSAQEDFTPEAFMLRRSMPWAEDMNGGLVFVSFGHSFAAFETILKRMLGKEDSVIDGLFSFTRPISGAYFWCPPISAGKLDLTAIGF